MEIYVTVLRTAVSYFKILAANYGLVQASSRSALELLPKIRKMSIDLLLTPSLSNNTKLSMLRNSFTAAIAYYAAEIMLFRSVGFLLSSFS